MIALDTVPNPPSTVDVTYATDNEQAGKLIGQYAAANLDGKKAVIAMLDLFNDQVVSVDIQRDHGFLEGMGIDPGSKTQNGQEAKTGKYTGGKGGSYQVVCHQPTTARSRVARPRWRTACPPTATSTSSTPSTSPPLTGRCRRCRRRQEGRHGGHDRRELQLRQGPGQAGRSPPTPCSTPARWRARA